MPSPLRLSATGIDLSPRVFRSTTVAASPALAAETVVCTLTLTADVQVQSGVILLAFGAFTMGTDGTTYNLKVRQTGTSGTVLAASGVCALAAAALGSESIVTFDASPTLPNQVYVLTATMANASAESEFSAASLVAIIV